MILFVFLITEDDCDDPSGYLTDQKPVIYLPSQQS